MSASPADGVIDPDLAVHGVPNVHVASSSTFVTSGQANSTFMIVAFAARLADHLAGKLGRPGNVPQAKTDILGPDAVRTALA